MRTYVVIAKGTLHCLWHCVGETEGQPIVCLILPKSEILELENEFKSWF